MTKTGLEFPILPHATTPTRLIPVGAAFPVLPVPGVVPGSLSKGSRDNFMDVPFYFRHSGIRHKRISGI